MSDTMQIQEVISTRPDPAIHGSTDSFRAALAAIDPDKQPAPSVPQDVADASISEKETPPQDEPSDSTGQLDETATESTTESPYADEHEDDTKQHLIPKSRFNKEIEKRKDLETQLSAERENRIRFETQLQMLEAQQHQVQQQRLQEQVQHVEEHFDPLDTETYNYAKREIDSLKQQLANVTYETTERTREMMYYNTVQSQEAAFAQAHPDFNDAMKHVQKIEFDVAKQLLGDDKAANDYVAGKLRDALTRSLNNGKNAAETIYNMAKTYGYNATSKQPKAVPTKNVEAIAKNMERSANTSNMGNSSTFDNIPVDIKAAIDAKGNIDPGMFHKMLQKAASR